MDKKDFILKAGPFTAVWDKKVLYKNLNIVIYENDFIFLTGPSGCGKSTLLKQIVGICKSNSDVRRILFFKEYGVKDICEFRRHVLLVMQNAPCIEGTVEENLFFPFKLKIADNTYRREFALALLKETNLYHLDLKKSAKELSAGERQRLAIVRALLWDPFIILADEPFSGLDDKNSKKVFRLLYSFSQKKRKAVLCVSHIFPEKEKFKIFELKDGVLKC